MSDIYKYYSTVSHQKKQEDFAFHKISLTRCPMRLARGIGLLYNSLINLKKGRKGRDSNAFDGEFYGQFK